MSAYIVERAHIEYLVECALRLGNASFHQGRVFRWYSHRESGGLKRYELSDENATEIGQLLWDENVISVAHRYGREDDLPGVETERPYVYVHGSLYAARPIALAQLFKAVHCYEYQSCEHGSWRDSAAWAFCEALKDRAATEVPGYEEAAWGVPEPEGSILTR